MINITSEAIFGSKAYKKASSRAVNYAKDPKKLIKLIGDATRKADEQKSGALKEMWESLMILLRMLKAYAAGDYRNISWQSVTLLVATIAYFVIPTDLIPDFIPGGLLIDDAALLGVTLRSLQSDIEGYLSWEDLTADVKCA